MRRLYARLGRRYSLLVLVGEVAASVIVAVTSVLLAATYFDPTADEVAEVMMVAAVVTALAVGSAWWRGRDAVALIATWQATAMPTPRETVIAWEVATTFTLRQYRRSSLLVNAAAILPTVGLAVWRWDLGWAGLGAMALAAVIPGLYATVLSYGVGEILVRPLVAEIAAELPDAFVLEPRGLPLARRLRLTLPVYTSVTGVAVAGLIGGGGGPGRLALAVVVSAGVGLFFSVELGNLLSASVTGPIAELRAQLARVRAEDFDARALVLGSDELGELAHDFNLMASGLAEREALRDAFGTYVDKEVVELILSGRFPQEGVEVDVSLLFCDVRDFTGYAERSTATEVIATLNDLFTEIVPVIEACGGHIDKFLGDGLLAVFGAPEPLVDHADRAVEAARRIVDVVHLGGTGLRIAAGVNSGKVVAGPLGGAGRLNFSVIGDAVNVAARVEAATRDTGDDVLVTAATRDRLARPQGLVSRGPVDLKGKAEPVEVFAAGPDFLVTGSAETIAQAARDR